MPAPETTSRSVAVVTLGCTRNDVDSEELAGRLAAGGWTLVEDAADADVAVVNTCGFVEQAKKDSIDTLLAANDLKSDGTVKSVVAVGCMAERYGVPMLGALPLDIRIRERGDAGIPVVVAEPDSAVAQAYRAAAGQLLEALAKRPRAPMPIAASLV